MHVYKIAWTVKIGNMEIKGKSRLRLSFPITEKTFNQAQELVREKLRLKRSTLKDEQLGKLLMEEGCRFYVYAFSKFDLISLLGVWAI